jgi:glycosyltransferase involved in cell wall biosynthesis
MINAYARKLGGDGWLFSDLLRHFGRAGAIVSHEPRADASAWIAIRTDEAALSPDPSRTVMQVHDMWDHNTPFSIGALVRTHPDQLKIYRTPPGRDLKTAPIPGFCRPIGALECFTLRERLSPEFTVGWVGRPRGGRSPRSPALLLDALARLPATIQRQTRVLLVGEGLESAEARIRELRIACEYHHRRDTPIESYPPLYHRMDCLVITSSEEAGPMCLFEAIASGVYVASTPVGWAKRWFHHLEPPLAGTLCGREAATVAEQLVEVFERREELFETRAIRRQAHEGLHGRWTLESWVRENLALAEGLIQ